MADDRYKKKAQTVWFAVLDIPRKSIESVYLNAEASMKGTLKRLGLILTFLLPLSTFAADVVYNDSWGPSGFTLESGDLSGVQLNFSVERFSLTDRDINGQLMQVITMPGTLLPNDEGMPNLPGLSRFIAVPRGAEVTFSVLDGRTDTFTDMEIAPAPDIPFDIEEGPLQYRKNEQVYGSDDLYPQNIIRISQIRQIRGVDVVLIGVTPFQYNPDSKELTVHRDLKIRLEFNGGSGTVGDARLLSRWWQPIIDDLVLNRQILPQASLPDYNTTHQTDDASVNNVEYLIITPDDADFIAWADSIKRFRNQQGIQTGIITTAEIGGNDFNTIESYIDDAYYNWDIPPSAVLLLGDYGQSGNTIDSSPEEPHPYSGTYVSDNYYADVDGDDLPDIVFSRITARDATDLQIMVSKILDYERHPPTNTAFYDNPVTAMGWQTERWFQLCSEIVNGFWEYELGKNPVRENAIYSGTPGDVWSTADNTDDVVDYFGPNGLGYIPQTPEHLTDWGGNATRVNNDINSGAFMIQHRDHGSETGWGEPDYDINDMDGLHNNDLTFVFSVNCLTGEFNMSGECFAEAFHRYEQRALGIIAASQVSYSFVNDTYTWGMYDNMWPQFMPDETTTPEARGILPSFANAAGKYFLQGSDWPYNTGDKEITYYLFHHHGGAYSTVYSELPQYLTVNHNDVLDAQATRFSVTADEGALIGLSVNDEIIGVGEGTGEPVDIDIEPQQPGDTMLVTVTLQNYYRYSEPVPVVESSGAYITVDSWAIDDGTSGNGNQQADYAESVMLDVTAANLGSEAAVDVSAVFSSDDTYLTITDAEHFYGFMDTNQVVAGNNAFAFDVANGVPDQHKAASQVTFTDTSGSEWVSNLSITLNAPAFTFGDLMVHDTESGNGDGVLDPGETSDITIATINSGHSDAASAEGHLTSLTADVTVNTSQYTFTEFSAGDTVDALFNISADEQLALGSSAFLQYKVTSGAYATTDTFEILIGEMPEFVMQDTTVSVANAMFYDTGGEYDNYSDGERITMTFTADHTCEGLTVKFMQFKTDDDDDLYIFDGPNQYAPQIPGSPFSGSELPPEYASTNNDGALTFVFNSNVMLNDEGWQAEFSPNVPLHAGAPEPNAVNTLILEDNFPNPFNPHTTIRFALPRTAQVDLVVHNIHGQKIRTLAKSKMAGGNHQVVWDGKNEAGHAVTSGIYFYTIKSGAFTKTRKMMLMK
ncbi:MAG: T9SS type A sorting domain-containing protein, partial [Caldithrix sp.]|nr:T9SS type A sorting domain-containing protein [Caldithrix sp.]